MATGRTMSTTTDAIRWIEASPRPIEKATDLGNVQVLKHSNLYLLTDQFGDIHPDGRGLGLYDGDTRRLSCAILRVSGQRPVLLQASTGSNYRGTIQLTNPRLERNLRDKVHPRGVAGQPEVGHRAPADARGGRTGGAAPARELLGGARDGRAGAGVLQRRSRHLRGAWLDPRAARHLPAHRDPRRPDHVPLRRPGWRPAVHLPRLLRAGGVAERERPTDPRLRRGDGGVALDAGARRLGGSPMGALDRGGAGR